MIGVEVPLTRSVVRFSVRVILVRRDGRGPGMTDGPLPNVFWLGKAGCVRRREKKNMEGACRQFPGSGVRRGTGKAWASSVRVGK